MAKLDPGWYDDPEFPDRHRWWDGSGWTAWLSDDRDAPPPPAGDVARVEPTFSLGEKVVRAMVVTAVVLALIWSAMAGIGVWLNHRNAVQHPVPWPTTWGPAPRSPAVDRYGMKLDDDGTTSWGPFRARLPSTGGFAPSRAGLDVDAVFAREAVAFKKGTASGPTSPQTLAAVGALERGGLRAENRVTAAAGFANLAVLQLYAGAKDLATTVVTAQPVSTFGAAHPAARAVLRVTWTDARGTHENNVTMLVVLVDGSNWAGWFEVRTPEASAADLAVLDAARATITIS